MDWNAITSIGSLLSGFTATAALVFAGIQFNQNKKIALYELRRRNVNDIEKAYNHILNQAFVSMDDVQPLMSAFGEVRTLFSSKKLPELCRQAIIGACDMTLYQGRDDKAHPTEEMLNNSIEARNKGLEKLQHNTNEVLSILSREMKVS